MTWKNDTGKPIYRDAENNIVDEGDPSAAYLVAGPDGTLPMVDARKYGLVKNEEPKQEEAQSDAESEQPDAQDKSVKQPAADKSMKPGEDK